MSRLIAISGGALLAAISVCIGATSAGQDFPDALRDALRGPEGSVLDRIFFVLLVISSAVYSLAVISRESAGWQAVVLVRLGTPSRLALRSALLQSRRTIIVVAITMVPLTIGIQARPGSTLDRGLAIAVPGTILIGVTAILVGLVLELAYRIRTRHSDPIVALFGVVILAQLPTPWNPITFAMGGLLTGEFGDLLRIAMSSVLTAVILGIYPLVLARQVNRPRRRDDSA